ncbi:MAG: hypothetical protein QM638_13370 [Nocardioides sp.]|uniref:hypothetical protein n=1 Tax=Nocardioides sp. TaxID=35761 RepID=UPI0039E427AB
MSTPTRVVHTAAGTLLATEHLARRLDEAGAARTGYLTSHLVATPEPRYVMVLDHTDELAARATEELPGLTRVPAARDVVLLLTDVSDDHRAAARSAVHEHRTRHSGRLLRYPGRTAIERRLTVREVIARSCVDEVAGLAGVDVTPDTMLDLTGFARPTWHEGRCRLLVQPGRIGLIPFEVRDQVSCCADH